MLSQLNLLIVDDSEDDVLLIARALEKENFKLTSKRVDNAADLTAALDAHQWDLILSDYSMPGFNGAEALALCRNKAFDAPFIIVSGRIGEEVAVDMMKAGASDYVMKDDLPRLAPAVTRELRAARDRKIRRQAQLAMAHLASIVETCDDAIISQTLGGTVLSWNSGAEQMFGYGAEDMVGEPIETLVPRDLRSEISDIRDVIQSGRRVERIETIRLRRDGTCIDVSITVSPIKNSDGHIQGASIVLRDITERKQQEKERSRLIEELTDALKRVKTLNGLLPICASCKKIRNDGGYWETGGDLYSEPVQCGIYARHLPRLCKVVVSRVSIHSSKLPAGRTRSRAIPYSQCSDRVECLWTIITRGINSARKICPSPPPGGGDGAGVFGAGLAGKLPAHFASVAATSFKIGELRMTMFLTPSNFAAATPSPTCALKLSTSNPSTSEQTIAGRLSSVSTLRLIFANSRPCTCRAKTP